VGHLEIQEKAEWKCRESQIGKQLSAVQWQQFFNTLDFDNYTTVDDEVDPVPGRDADIIVTDSHWNLVLERQVPPRELATQARVVHTFQQPCTHRTMHRHRRPDHLIADLVWSHGIAPFASSTAFASFVHRAETKVRRAAASVSLSAAKQAEGRS